MNDRTDVRIPELDGLRGWAAVSVFVWHALDVFHPAIIGGALPDGTFTPAPMHRLARTLPIGAAFNGQFAVYIFFALSGFVLARQLVAGQSSRLAHELIACRWFRLLPVVVIGSALGFAVLRFGLLGGLDAVAAADGLDPSTLYDPTVYDQLDLWGWVRQTFGTVWAGQPANQLFDRVLWTIGVEFQCSVLVYTGVAAFRPMRNRLFAHVVMSFAGLCIVGAHYLPFGIGVAMAEWWSVRPPPTPEPRWRRWLAWGSVGVAVWLGGIHPDVTKEVWLPFRSLLPEELRCQSATRVLHAVAAGLFLHATLTRPLLQGVLRHRVSQCLGYVSYPLYAVHQPLLYALGSVAFAAAVTAVGYTPAALLASGTTFIVSAALGAVVTRFVDTPANRLAKSLVRRWANSEPRGNRTDPAVISPDRGEPSPLPPQLRTEQTR